MNDGSDKVYAWASENKLRINMDKTKEIVFHRPHCRNLLLPTTLPGIERVLSTKLLGVCFQADLGMGIHVDTLLKFVNLIETKTRNVWTGYASRADIVLIQKLFLKARHWGIVYTY